VRIWSDEIISIVIKLKDAGWIISCHNWG